MKHAISVTQMKPAEFWELTLAEFNVIMEAHEMREENEMWKNAQMASWMLMPHYEEPITAAQLMGESETEDEEDGRQATTKDDLEEMKRRMGR